MRMFGFCIACLFTAASSLYAAIPTAAECEAVADKIDELTADDYAALKAGKKSHAETGDALVSYVTQDDKTAVKFVLCQKTYEQYVLGKAFNKADGVYGMLQSEEGTEYAQAVVQPMALKLSGFATSRNPEAKTLKTRIENDGKSIRRVNAVKAQIGKDPGNLALSEKLGVEYAAIGEWEGALASFATAEGEIAKIAAWELSETRGTDYTADKVAAFWWGYADRYAKQKRVTCQFKSHAAMWYKTAIGEGLYKGIDEKLAQKRIAEADATDAPVVAPEAGNGKGLLHRWSFTGNLKDSVGKSHGEPQGNVVVDKTCCKLNPGAVNMSDILSKDDQKAFTIEMWFTEDKFTFGSRVVILSGSKGQDGHQGALWASGDRKSNEGYFGGCGVTSRGTACQGFDVGHKNYIAIAVSRTPKGTLSKVYRCDLTNGKRVETFEAEGSMDVINNMILGWTCRNQVSQCSVASYDEVRVWKRAFSIDDVNKSVQSGPDRLPALR